MLWRRVCGLTSASASCGSLGPGLVLADDPCDAAAAELGSVLVEEHRVVVVAGPVQAVFGQVGGQHRRRVAHQGDVAGLAALPGQGGHGGVLQADVADGEVGEFLDPGGGVVERGEQGRVAAALAGGPVGLGEQAAGLLDGQVVHVRADLFLGGDGEDVLVAGHPGRVLGLHPGAERADRGQALVARRRAVAPAGSSQSRNPVMAAASTRSRVSLPGGMDLSSRK